MYNILIVDDERIEREGIEYLIRKHNMELNVTLAEDGEVALEYIRKNHVDILFTDIKMPFMDGIELSQQARVVCPDMKIIFYSAYGEFEYAKKAIDINVYKYILKPIQVKEFLDTMNEVVFLCKKEEEEKQLKIELQKHHQKSIKYEKEKVLFDILHGADIDDSMKHKMKEAGVKLDKGIIQLILLDFQSKFFDVKYINFENKLNEFIKHSYYYLNLNERQSVIFLKIDLNMKDKFDIGKFGNSLKEFINKTYNADVFVVIGIPVSDTAEIAAVFKSLDQIDERRFFFDSGAVLFSEGTYEYDENYHELLGHIARNIFQSIDERDNDGININIEMFFDRIRGSKNISTIFVKYICLDIAKKLYEYAGTGYSKAFYEIAEEIFNVENLHRLKELFIGMIRYESPEADSNGDEPKKKVIENILDTIKKHYMEDLNLQSLAEKVYLSPSYLSYLFKQEIGSNIIQYLTLYRLEKAKELLRNTNLKVTDISRKVGYPNSSYFGSIFKNYNGVTPAQYRERGN